MMTVTPVAAMTVAMATVHVHAVSTAMSAMPTTVATVTASRSRGDSGSGQSERGDSCERDFTKHILVLHVARRDCLMR